MLRQLTNSLNIWKMNLFVSQSIFCIIFNLPNLVGSHGLHLNMKALKVDISSMQIKSYVSHFASECLLSWCFPQIAPFSLF